MRYGILVIGFLLAANLNAQRDAFILVDVSGSVNDNLLLSQSRDLIGDMLTGNFNVSGYSDWEPVNIADQTIKGILSGNNQPIAGNGSYICIMPFGNKDRYLESISIIISQFPDELTGYLSQQFPMAHADNFTYTQIAQAYTAELAKAQGIANYYLFIVTDDLGDQENTSSQNTYTAEEQNYMLAWNNAMYSKVVTQGSIRNQNLYIHIKKVELIGQTPAPPPPPCEIKMLSYAGGISGNEVKVTSDMVSLAWSCTSCPDDAKFNASIISTDGNARNNIRANAQTNKYSTRLNKGKYKVTITATGCKPGSTYIQVKGAGGSGGGLIVLLLALGAGAGGYFFWKRQQDKKLNKTEPHDFAEDKDEPVIIRKRDNEPDETGLF